MRGIYLVVGAALFSAPVSIAQVTIKRVVPRIYVRVPSNEANLRQRVADILAREVRLRSEYEDFIKDMTALGRVAVPDIILLAGSPATDRFVTESLLRLGGPDVLLWVEGVLVAKDHHVRQAFLAGVPAVPHIDGSVRLRLTQLLHDRSAEVRALAIQKLHTLVPAREMLTRCHDMNREVARTAILTVSRRWLFLDHGADELNNLKTFVGILEMHRRDDRWDIGHNFLLAFQKDRLADTKLGRELRARTKKLPWFAGVGASLSSKRLATLRAELGKRTAGHDEFLAKSLKKMPADAGADLLLVLADDSDAKIRMAACKAGLALLDPELARSFVRFLKDPDPEVRARAKQLLEQTGFYADQKRRWSASGRL